MEKLNELKDFCKNRGYIIKENQYVFYVESNDGRDNPQELFQIRKDRNNKIQFYKHNCLYEKALALNNDTALIKEWAKERKLHTQNPSKQIIKLAEEYGELAEAYLKTDIPNLMDAIGDMYVVMTILCMQLDLDIEECIELAYKQIKDRKGRLIDGVFVKEEEQ